MKKLIILISLIAFIFTSYTTVSAKNVTNEKSTVLVKDKDPDNDKKCKSDCKKENCKGNCKDKSKCCKGEKKDCNKSKCDKTKCSGEKKAGNHKSCSPAEMKKCKSKCKH